MADEGTDVVSVERLTLFGKEKKAADSEDAVARRIEKEVCPSRLQTTVDGGQLTFCQLQESESHNLMVGLHTNLDSIERNSNFQY